MKDILFELMNYHTKGADTYYNRGNVWLIFTKEKRWVFELTKEGTLWYNYYFFENFMKLLSMDVVENQDYITKWVEGFIENGVEESNFDKNNIHIWVEDTIQNGVKHTHKNRNAQPPGVEDTIQNGVKHTEEVRILSDTSVEYIIQNGVKHTEYGDWLDGDERLDNIIENGVKETKQEEHHRLRNSSNG